MDEIWMFSLGLLALGVIGALAVSGIFMARGLRAVPTHPLMRRCALWWFLSLGPVILIWMMFPSRGDQYYGLGALLVLAIAMVVYVPIVLMASSVLYGRARTFRAAVAQSGCSSRKGPDNLSIMLVLLIISCVGHTLLIFLFPYFPGGW